MNYNSQKLFGLDPTWKASPSWASCGANWTRKVREMDKETEYIWYIQYHHRALSSSQCIIIITVHHHIASSSSQWIIIIIITVHHHIAWSSPQCIIIITAIIIITVHHHHHSASSSSQCTIIITVHHHHNCFGIWISLLLLLSPLSLKLTPIPIWEKDSNKGFHHKQEQDFFVCLW